MIDIRNAVRLAIVGTLIAAGGGMAGVLGAAALDNAGALPRPPREVAADTYKRTPLPVPRATATVTVSPGDYMCNGLHGKQRRACTTLANRPAVSCTHPGGAVISDPAGGKLVAECREQYTSRELTYCLTQPKEC